MTEQALELARKGFYVFPIVEDGKKPAITGWPHRATTDEETIRKWWAAPNEGRNIGIATEPSNLIVVDLDDKNGKCGSDEFDKLCYAHGYTDTMMVDTPSGGYHLYFHVPEGMTLKSTACAIADGIDTRAVGGFVVAPGSSIEGKFYRVASSSNVAITTCPDWIAEKVQRPPATIPSDLTSTTLDSEIDIQAAIQYLKGAPAAISGEGGDAWTFELCCILHNMGISITKAVALMQEHWNHRCVPNWSVGDLVEKMSSAYKYAKEPAGCRSLDLPSLTPKTIHCVNQMPLVPPPRDWIVEGRLISGYVTLTVAPGGVGKSMFTMLEAMAVATGRNLTGVEPTKRGPVLIYNTEDPQDEIERRILAICQHYDINPRKLDNLYYASGAESPLRFVVGQNGKAIVTKDKDMLVDLVNDHNIQLVVIDPFVRSHSVNENSNNEIDMVVQQLSSLAISTQCAVSVVHHTRKLASSDNGEDMDVARGASSLVSAARIVHTIAPLTEDERTELSVPDDLAWTVVKMQRVKGNMSEGGSDKRYFRKVSVEIESQDKIGVLELADTESRLPQRADEVALDTEWLVDKIGSDLGSGAFSPLSVAGSIRIFQPDILEGLRLHEREQLARDLFATRLIGKEYNIELKGHRINIGEINGS